MMSEIVEVYSREIYLPFIKFCQERKYNTMEDLERCPFDLLCDQPGFSTTLVSRVRAVYTSYLKANSTKGERRMTAEIARATRPKQDRPLPPATEPEAVKALLQYFRENSDRLISADETFKAVGGRMKKADITRILQQVAWCKVVEKGSYFYVPMDS